MAKFDLKKMNKRGQSSVNSKITYMVGALIVIVLATALGPTMFSNIAGLDNDTDTPSWVPTVLYVIVGAGLVFLIWKAFGNDK